MPALEYLHIAIDDHSRLAFAQLLPDETAQSAVAFLHAALAFFHKHGIQTQRVYSDNGSCYRAHAMRDAVAALGLKHRFPRPYTPKTNGKAERFIQTSLREWAYAHAYVHARSGQRTESPWPMMESPRTACRIRWLGFSTLRPPSRSCGMISAMWIPEWSNTELRLSH